VSRAKRLIKAASEYIPDAIETPLLKAFGVELSRAPRPRQKPKVRTDNPGGEWLKHERRRADERVRSGGTKVSGAVTGYLKKPIELDPRKLEVIPGARNERRVPGEFQYDALRPLIEAEGFRQDSPILVGINHLGDPYIIEGNTRASVARDLGIDRIPAEVRYFAGGEGVEGPMMPSRLEEYMPPSELSLDPNFRRFFGNSKLRDEYGEPQRLYHATPENFSEFKAGGIDPKISGSAIWLGPYADYQPAFHRIGGSQTNRFREGANVMPLYARMENPLLIDDKAMEDWASAVFADGDGNFPNLMPQHWVDNIRSEGYDGIMYARPEKVFPSGETSRDQEYIVFDPKQIKSAIGNRGTYDPEDPDINMARGGLAVKPSKFAVKKKSKTRKTSR
jgi:hypothetical protein